MEHPMITQINRNGYPDGFEEPEPYFCEICGQEVEEYIYRDYHGDIIGCDRCVRAQEYWEVEK